MPSAVCALHSSTMILKLIASVFGTSSAYVLYWIARVVYRNLTSPLRYLPGPKSAHWLLGNMKEFADDNGAGLEERWVQEYGHTFKVHLLLVSGVAKSGSGIASNFVVQNSPLLHTTDTKAIHHFLSRTEIYQKLDPVRESLSRIVGPGVLVVEGDEHKQQRKIMNPAFAAPQICELTSIFISKSMQLRDIWEAQAAKAGGAARVEVLSWLSKATLDIIGLAGFNYEINALGTEGDAAPADELSEAYEAAVAAEGSFSVMRLLQMRFRVLRRIPLRVDAPIRAFQATTLRIGRRLFAESKREIAENGTFETGRARDLLTLLVRANTAKDIPESQRLSDEDVIAQVPTFLVAGHETTSTAVTWALFALTQNPNAQTRLREELFGISTDTPTMDELNSLPYLDCVVRETLRLYAPVPSTSREALREDVVPLGTPVTDSRGVVHDSLRILKGQLIVIPILCMNRDSLVWGPNAMEFVPERWESVKGASGLNDAPGPANSIPGIWGHMLTFLGGPRGCIGFRFSLVEMKALLFVLMRAFEFALAVPLEDVGRKDTAIVRRPIVLSEPEKGFQLPLLVKPVVR
ncbi:cytochrome P450 [Mycena crocata]|nr:cytochrome P450 [Mycena crocata]